MNVLLNNIIQIKLFVILKYNIQYIDIGNQNTYIIAKNYLLLYNYNLFSIFLITFCIYVKSYNEKKLIIFTIIHFLLYIDKLYMLLWLTILKEHIIY